MYRHIIWDFDGTLFDTYPVMGNAFKKALEEEGIEESIDDILAYMKVSMPFAIQHYEEKYQIDSIFLEKYSSKLKAIEDDCCKPYKEIVDICKYIYEFNRYNYLFTHRGESSIRMLQKNNIYYYFTECITSQNGFERKPSPNAINYLIEKYNMQRNDAIMIGDRELDMLSAKNAGIHACYFNEYGKTNDNADYIISSFHQLYKII